MMLPTTRTAVLYASIVAIGGFIFGVDAAVIGGVIPYLTAPPYSFEPLQISLIVGAPTLAAVIASLTSGLLSDLFGRKRILLLLSALYVISAFLSATAREFWFVSDFWALFLARAIGGYAFGSLALAPVYIAEISPAHLRGRMVGINQLTIVTGFAAAYFSNLAILGASQAEPAAWAAALGLADAPWRWMLGAELLPALIWLGAMFAVPESPRWLVTKNRSPEARSVLARVLPPDQVDAALSDIQRQVNEAASVARSRFADLFRPAMRFALVVGLVIAIIQQITGINTVFFYATTIFQLSGIGTNAAFTQTVLVGITNVVFTLVAMALVDRIGRRPLMITGLAGVTASFALVAYGFASASYVIRADDLFTTEQAKAACLAETGDEETCATVTATLATLAPAEEVFQSAAAPANAFAPATLLAPLIDQEFTSDVAFKRAVADALSVSVETADGPVAVDGVKIVRGGEALLLSAAMEGRPMLILIGIIAFVAAFALSLGPVMWIFLAEIFPARVRGTAISFVTVFNSSTAFLVTTLFPLQVAATGVAGVFMGYAAFALIGLGLVIWLMPETKGLSLEQIETQFAKKGRG